MSDNQRITAVAKLIQHTGAEQFQVRYADDEKPIVWFCVAGYPGDRWETAAALDPEAAAWRLAEQLVDGGTCARCGQPAALEDSEVDLTRLPFLKLEHPLCQYRYRNGQIVRGCDSLPVGSR